MLNQGGYVISPGAETFIKLTSKSVKRLGKPHGTCENIESRYGKFGKHFETIRECWQRQAIQAMMKRCGCIPHFFAATMFFSGNKSDILDEALALIKSNGTNIDNHPLFQRRDPVEDTSANATRKRSKRSDVRVSHKELLAFLKSPYFKQSCGIIQQPACEVLVQNMITKGDIQFSSCPEPCHYQEWESVVTSIPFPPTKQYFEKFLKSEKLQGFDEARESIARVHVYYDEIRMSTEDQIPAYQIHNFVAEFGGTVDLFIGFSFFTLIQLIEICIATCYFSCRNSDKVNTEKDDQLS
jgi:hypothetical protein